MSGCPCGSIRYFGRRGFSRPPRRGVDARSRLGRSVQHVAFRAICTEVNARTEIQALAIGKPVFLNDKEAAAATKTNDTLVDRPWALWKQKAMPK